LLAAGLAIRIHDSVVVNETVPPVPARLVKRMPAALRRAHARVVPVVG
jgi:hypothetical protein